MIDIADKSGVVEIGRQMHELLKDLYPICRSITGNGVRETLERIRQQIPIILHEVPSGTEVFDWSAPNEWYIKDAYVVTPTGEKIAEFKKHNLHVLNYSVPVHTLDSFHIGQGWLYASHNTYGNLPTRGGEEL